MQDFLQGRPTLETGASTVLSAPNPLPATSHGPFARLTRESPAAASLDPGARPGSAPAAHAHETGEHQVQVQPVLENGRVTRILVTCACGRVTEIACVY